MTRPNIPPLKLWKDTGLAEQGPNALQKRYYINCMPPDKRPHPHTKDLLLSIGGYGSGKCLKKGTPVLLWDGRIAPVEDIVVGDILMGPDSTPRNVLELGRGRETFYKVTPIKGEPFYCNESHILSLKRSTFPTALKPNVRYPGQEIINVSVKEYLTWSKRKKAYYKLYRADQITFPNSTKLALDAYCFWSCFYNFNKF